jgi:uncharacterized protein YbaR (Trm112 family)
MAYEPSPELLAILRDPETKGPLRLATDGELARLREAVAAGRAARADGKDIPDEIEAAFLAQEGAVAYVVIDGIPVLLVEERLQLDPPLKLDAKIENPTVQGTP